MGKILSVSIFKGGAGKTATAVSLASALASLGTRVLLIDLDQQASATRHLGLDPDDENPNLYHVFKRLVTAGTAIKELGYGFSAIPGNSLLAAIEEALEEGDETMLRDLVAGIKHDFDYIILDTPPGKAMLSLTHFRPQMRLLFRYQQNVRHWMGCRIFLDLLLTLCGKTTTETSK